MTELESLHHRHQGDYFFIPTGVGHEHHNKVSISMIVKRDIKCLIFMPALNQIGFVCYRFFYLSEPILLYISTIPNAFTS